MKISIGILAWNEEATLATTIRSLLEQTIFTAPRAEIEHIEIVCVANGCTDRTVAVADDAFRDCQPASRGAHVDCRTVDIATPGKCNAWIVFIHEICDGNADYIFLMDADIWFSEERTFWHMIQALESDSRASVAVDLPKKDIAFKKRKSVLDRLSLARSQLWESGPSVLCGHLYCGRGTLLRRIWMPVGLFLDDLFLKGMVVTACFTSETDESRVVRASDASHVFEAYTRIPDIYRHERLMVIGTVVNSILFDYLRNARTDAGLLISKLNEENPEWFKGMVRTQIASSGWWTMPSPLSLQRFNRLKGLPLKQCLLRMPIALMAALFDVLVFVSANRTIKEGDSAFRWNKMRSSQ